MNLYLLFKSLHLIAVISWMAGLLYLQNIFYHATADHESQKSVFKVMEKTLQLHHDARNDAIMVVWSVANS